MSEDQFIAYMERIPVMEEKLNRLLLAFSKIAENGNMTGIVFNSTEGEPFVEYSDDKHREQQVTLDLIQEKVEEAKKLQKEADELREQLDI